MSKIKVNIEPFEYFYKIIGIASPLKAYKVSYFINSALKINLKRIEDFKVDIKNKKESNSYEQYKDNEQNISYLLFNNKAIGKNLFKTYKGLDYVLLVKQDSQINFADKIIKDIKETKMFNIVFIAPKVSKTDETLINKNILYTDLEKEKKD